MHKDRCGPKMRLIVFDIDGVITDGTVQIDEFGHEYKRFYLNDIDALNLLSREGYILAAITGEDGPIADFISRKVPWKHFILGCKMKLEAFKTILKLEDCQLDESAYIGDGVYDVPVLKYVPKSICPANAVPAAKEAARIHLHCLGGHGCVVELYEMIKSRQI